VFDQDFSACYLDNQCISEIPITAILTLITESERSIQSMRFHITLVQNAPNNMALDFHGCDDKKVSKRKEWKQIIRSRKKFEKALSQLRVS
jgi:hypothetical protein